MPQSVCPDAELLSSYLLGTIADEQAERVDAHLPSCTNCLGRLESLSPEDPMTSALRAQRGRPRFNNPVIEKLRSQLREARPPSLADASMQTSPLGQAGPTLGGQIPLRDAEPDDRPFPFLLPAQGPGEIGRLGPYRVQRQLGAGGMGMVFQAEDPQLRRLVALKVMRPNLAVDAKARARFLREAQATARLTHDHIIPIYQVGEAKGVPYLAMPLLHGETLEERMRGFPPLSLAESVRIARETALALAAAHEQGVIHRDIKPANLWLEGPAMRVKVLDFGLAWMEMPEGEQTATGAVLGTPGYMAPEQTEGDVDARADLFSLGCVLYRLATGQPPFKGETALQRLRSLLESTPAPPQQLNLAIPAPLGQFILRLLSKNRDERPVSAAVVAKVLESLAVQLPVAGPTPAAPPMAVVVGPAAAPPALAIPMGPPPRTFPAATPLPAPTLTTFLDEKPRTKPLDRLRPLAAAAKTAFTSKPPLRNPWVGAVAAVLLLGVSTLGWRSFKPPVTPPERAEVAKKRTKGRAPAEYELPQGVAPFADNALVTHPEPVKGVQSWTIHPLSLITMRLNGLSFVPGSRQLQVATPANVSDLYLRWDAADPSLTRLPFNPSNYADVTPDGKVAVAWGDPPQIREVGVNERQVTLLGAKAAAGPLLFSPNGKVLLTGGADLNGLIFWDVKKGLKLKSVNVNLSGAGARWSWDSSKVAILRQNTIDVVSVVPGKVERTLKLSFNPASLSWSPDGKWFAALENNAENARFFVIDAETGKDKYVSPRKTAVGPVGPVWSGDADESEYLAYVRPDGEVVVWDVKTEKEKCRCKGRTGEVVGLAFEPEGWTLVTMSKDNVLRFWSTQTGDPRGMLMFPDGGNHWLAISPTGHHVGSTNVENAFIYQALLGERVLDRTTVQFRALGWRPDKTKVQLIPPSSSDE